MPTPIDNLHYFYRLRIGTSNSHSDLYYYNGNFAVGTFDSNTNERWMLRENHLINVKEVEYLCGNSGEATLGTSTYATDLTFPSGAYSGTNYIRANNGNYLNWTNGKLVWESTARTSWRFELLLRFINIPNSSVDYFTPKCGNSTGGTFPSAWTTKIRNLYKTVFGVTTCDDSKAFYNLYGAIYNNEVTPISYRGKYHTGIDMRTSVTSGTNANKIYAPIGGKVVYVDPNWGSVAIQYNNSEYNFLLAHMSDIQVKKDQIVKKDDYIGKQSNTGLGANAGKHLHFEVTKSNKIGMPLPSGSWENLAQTVSPYDFL